ncbi:MAG: CHAT domain-containing protein [Gordonia sp. (in: high G+C Gram-positive bacteria)]|uniref:CHAT domain-containing protein n=1 Tax=Gordonia sp. (in: high G+C Gram-positive bacteria) TaxID=84139 RepID=UPI0039E3D76A
MVGDCTLLIRAFDADTTYLSYRWLDDPENPVVHAVTAEERSVLLAPLAAGLIAGDLDDQVRRAVTGPLTRRDDEAALSRALGRGLLPDSVIDGLRARSARVGPPRVSVRITPSRALARVPWELLAVHDDERLIESATVQYEPPAAIHVGRRALPEPWERVADKPVCYLVDPELPAGSGLGQVVTGTKDEDEFQRRISLREHTLISGIGETVHRWELAEELGAGVRRLFYFGHVSTTLDQPGSSSLHLSDSAREWGLAEPMNSAHRPLSALDLFAGTATPEHGPDDAVPQEVGKSGAELWPMPPRVAVIACEGGADYRSAEIFGLVTAMFTAGAEVVTTTRWPLPTDTAFRELAGVARVPGPTVELALAVDRIHELADPVAGLAEWQRDKLAQWRAAPGPATSPLTWAAIGNHVCPVREVRTPEPESVR